MKAKNKLRLNRVMSIILVFMLLSYYVPIGLLVATAEGTAENTEEPGVFTLEIVENGEVEGETVAIAGATVEASNTDGIVKDSGVTDDNGIVKFSKITNADLQGNNTFDFVVTQNGEEKTFSIVVKDSSTEYYKYNWTSGQHEIVEIGPDPGSDPEPNPEPETTFEVTVDTSSSSGSGIVTIGDEEYVNPLKIKDGDSIVVNITPHDNSEIESIIIGGVEKDIPDEGSFEETIQVTADTLIDVNFAKKIYSISFSSYENGTVEDEIGNVIDAAEGKITASHGTNPSFTVIPNTGFHIDEIIIDGEEFDFLDKLLDDGSFEHSFPNIDKDHSVEISFAINKYQITTSVNGENGTINPELLEVEHDENGEVTIEITPDEDYQIKSLTDNTVSVVDAVLQEDGTYFYEIVGIVENHNIVVEFEEITPAKQPWEEYVSIEVIDSTGKLIDFDASKNIYIYSNDARVRIKPLDSKAMIKLNGQWGFWNWKKEVIIDENTTIKEIEIGKGMRKEKISFDPNFLIHFDEQQPEISEVSLAGSHEVTIDNTVWFSGGVTVTGKAKDVEQTFEENDFTYSPEIVNVYYAKGEYSPDNGTEATFDKTTNTFEFMIPEEEYSGIYSIWAEDEAGNVTVQPVDVNIDKTVPSLINGEAVTFEQVNSNNMSEFINFLSFGTFFNKEVEITVRAEDKGAGIESIDLKATGSEETVDIEKGEFTRKGSTATQIFTIDKEEFTGSLSVVLTDRTNNTSEPYLITKDNSNIDADNNGIIMIEKVDPTADIYLTSGTTGAELEDGQEFNQDVSLNIDAEDTDSGLNEVVISVNGEEIDSHTYHSEQTNQATYTISTDAMDSDNGKFTVSVYVIDNAGNTSTTEKTVYVDKSSPVIKGIYLETTDGNERKVIDEEDILEDYVEQTEYGYYFKKDLVVTVVAEDQVVSGEHTSGVESMVVYLKDAEGKYYAVLEDGSIELLGDSGAIYQITPIPTESEVSFEVPASFKGEIVAKATDPVGNTGAFESAQGTIVESPEQHSQEEHIAFSKAGTTYKDNQGVDLYNEDQPVELTVTDTYSGIAKIEWSVEAPHDTDKNQYGSLTINNDKSYGNGSNSSGWVQSQIDHNLVTEMKKTINVNHNSNDIVVRVKMTDRAGNTSEEELKLSIDKTAPELEIEYDNNTPDEENGDIYDQSRTATITITERNFNPEDVQYEITNTGGDIPVFSEWTKVEPEEGEHPDKTKHIATIAFTGDGDYNFSISYTDSASNPAPEVEDQTFTIDQSAPEVSVTYDNNDVANGNYYNEKRIATITVTEHNFDPNRVEISGSTTIIGESIEALPPLSEWSSDGDVHQATIVFEEDALYHYDFVVSDTAGNTSEDFEAEEFYIDKTNAKLIDGEAVTFEQKNDGNIAKVLNFLTFGTFFNKEVHITVQTQDETSGIEEIELKTTEGQPVNQDDISISEDELTGEAVFVLDVDNFDAAFEVDITDLAHNVGTYPVTEGNSNIVSNTNSNIVVEKKKPKVSIDVKPDKGVKSYKNQYNGDVTFEITAEDVDSGINTVIIDVNGKKYEYDYSDLDEMQQKPDAYRINTNHKDIVGNEDGSYLVSVSVVDNAGNENEAETKIYIDKTKPIITNYAFSVKGKNGFVKVDETDQFKKSLELTEYGYYFKEPTQVKISGKDPKVDKQFTSNLKTITVYLRDHENGKYYAALKDGSLKEIKESEITSITPIPTKNSVTVNVPKAFKGQIFAQATDYVHNISPYIAPNGMVVENNAQHNKETHIKLDRAKAPFKDNNGVDLYSNNVNVELTVTDTYSGIEEIEWTVVAPYDTGNNQSGKLKLNNDKTYADGSNTQGWKQTRTQLNLVTEMKKTIAVDHNSNDIKVRVKMTDRAGHTSEEEITFSIDKTSPSIDVTYDNNSPDPQHQDYYKENRTATITITERNFKPEDVIHVITNTDNVIPTLNGWSSRKNSNNPDLTTHTATITYSADGDYTFDIQYTDNAGNKAAPVAQDSFTIDKTKPVINVSYDTDDAMNENYYNTARTATISVTEHNFDPSRIEVIGTAFHDGEVVNFPSLSGWTRNGDVHTASIVYSNDALYRFDIDYTDMAGNVADDFSPQEFHVDQTEPELTIIGVEDMSANNGEVAPIIRYSDTNFDPDSVKIELTGSNRGEVKIEGEYSGRNNGQVFIFDDFARTKENDDLYTLTATLVDLAGNETTEEIRFSVNRFGSVYAFDDSLDALVGKYVQKEQDIIVTETNVNSLDKDSISLKMTHNGSPTDLVVGEDYTISETGGEDKWSQYTYTIHKELFTGDGRYTIAFYSEDAAGNTNENIDETKKAEISFGIDKTNPVVVPIDIEDGEQYAVDSKTATISIKDNLVLDQVKINLNNEEINFVEDGENYTFVIPNSNSTQEVTILATDAAGNEITTEVKDFLVTTNLLVRWYNNTPLFIGSLGGVGVIGVALAAFFLYRKKNNVSNEVEMEEKAG
ncbi:Ig-like domain repeat protein [Paucisalibacillus sp. EB02]|uniref:Ig-like domain repeat protein n=1 Tax=Paucisalibacillus sp. EB02 TaxID=1347087 RepID=UPI0004BCE3CA|nr:Ig-like domain repeat protein [Paucisalibacillus sp. EB02]